MNFKMTLVLHLKQSSEIKHLLHASIVSYKWVILQVPIAYNNLDDTLKVLST